MSTKNLFESSKSFKGNGMIDGPPPPEGEEEENALSLYGRYETLRLKTKKFVSTHIIGIYYNELLIYLSIFSTLQYVYSTYSSVNKSSFQKSLDSLEMVLAALFAFDWMLSFFMADHKLDFLFR